MKIHLTFWFLVVVMSLLAGCPSLPAVDDGATVVEPPPGQDVINETGDSVPPPMPTDEVPNIGGITDPEVINPEPPTLGPLFPGQAYRVGNSPDSVTNGDLDGDGDQDLAVANLGSSDFSILFGNGVGAFSTPVNYAVGDRPIGIEAGDLDGDGDLDLVVLSGDLVGIVSVFENDGNGIFTAGETIDAGIRPLSLALNDRDGDGDLDLTVNTILTIDSGIVALRVMVVSNHGDGTFGDATFSDAPATLGLGDGFSKEGDLDGDGDLDFVTFGPINLNDLDGDGDLDLAVIGPGVEISLNNGDGTFSAMGVSTLPIGDEVFDPNGVSVLLNNGDGTFAVVQRYQTGDDPNSITTGDWDGDGDPDLAVTNFVTDVVSILLNNGDGTFLAAAEFIPRFLEFPSVGVPTGAFASTLGDLDGDGDLDLAVSGTIGALFPTETVSILMNDGTGTFTTVSNISVDDLGGALGIASGDLDDDGDLDLAVTATMISSSVITDIFAAIAILRNNGDGTFASPVYYSSPSHKIAIGDLDGDGDRDLVGTVFLGGVAGRGAASILLNNGEGMFATAVDYTVGEQPEFTDIGDLDGDGDLDLAVANGGDVFGSVSILMNNGNGTFAAAKNYRTRAFAKSVKIGDFDGDGYQDLAVGDGDPTTGAVSILRNNGDGTFAPRVDFATAVGEQDFIAAGDINGDGKLDLAVATSSDLRTISSISVLLGNGDGSFAEAMIFIPKDGVISVSIGDVDGDGDLDLAVLNGIGVSIMLNQLIP